MIGGNATLIVARCGGRGERASMQQLDAQVGGVPRLGVAVAIEQALCVTTQPQPVADWYAPCSMLATTLDLAARKAR